MTGPDALSEIATTFAHEGVRWLVVGGYAVIAHGYVRLTNDLDIVLDLDDDNCRRSLEALRQLGFTSRLPVDLLDFADPAKRRAWHDEKDMVVFTVWRQPEGRFEQVDLFLREPFPFADAWAERHVAMTEDGLNIPCISFNLLCQMKLVAGRPKDLDDLANLQRVHR